MNTALLIVIILVSVYALYRLITGILAKRKAKKLGMVEAGKEYFKDQATPEPRTDKKAAEEWSPKSLGGQPLYYNEVDHTYGRFLGLFRTDADKADARVIHNDC